MIPHPFLAKRGLVQDASAGREQRQILKLERETTVRMPKELDSARTTASQVEGWNGP
jgi:hypothetical protein